MKRFGCIWAILLLLLPLGIAARAEPAYTGGDLDGDGIPSARDAALVLRAASGHITLDNAESARADVTGSQSVNSADATAILLYASGRVSDFSDIVRAASGGLLGDRFLDRFAYRGTVRQGASYRSASVSVSVRTSEFEGAVCYIADIYVQDVTSFRTAFASGSYLGARQDLLTIAADAKAVLAVNGDLYTYRTRGLLIRNGVWYRAGIDKGTDLCVLYQNGVLATYPAGTVTEAEVRAGNPYQSWVCGPCLLDGNGESMESFTCAPSRLHAAARSAIGYHEPGHYVIVVVDSKVNPASKGLTMAGLSRLFQSLGCTAAYNLYGGQSSSLAASGELISYAQTLRTISDIICIAEPVSGGAA